MDSLPHTLNANQQQAVLHTIGPVLIVAGAGTGKTSVITEKIRHLISSDMAKPEEILTLSFNDKAAEEIQTRVDRILDVGYGDLKISTFHAFCKEMLHEFGLSIGLPYEFRVLSETDSWLLMREHLDRFTLNYYRPLGNPTKHITALLRHFSSCRDEMITPEAYLAYAENAVLDIDAAPEEEKSRITEIAKAYHVYHHLLAEEGVLDFSSLIYFTVLLLQERKIVQHTLHKRYKYILVDEFQDVNHAQYTLVKLLTGPETSLTVVGDDDQSIYAFRGASVSNILRFTDDFPHAARIVLTENYRSGQKILDTAYQVIQSNNPDRLEVKLSLNKKLLAKGIVSEGEVVYIPQERGEDEVKAVVTEISRLKETGEAESWDDIAILVRANSHATPFLEALERAHIPYEFLASVGLYRQPIVLDALSFFKILVQSSDEAAMFRLLRLPSLSLSDADLQALVSHEERKKISLYESAKRSGEWGVSEEGSKKISKLLAAITQGMSVARQGKPVEVLYAFLDHTGYLAYLTKEEQAGNEEVVRQIAHIKTFFDELEAFQAANEETHIAHFLERYRYTMDAGDEGKADSVVETPDSVNVLTIHGSKGLEFKFVFVVNLVEERFPTRRRSDPLPLPEELITESLPTGDEHIEEERRLFYVATTRAKQTLYLTNAVDYGGVRAKKISRFLIEAGLAEDAPKVKKKEEKKAPATTLFPISKESSMRTGDSALIKPPSSFSFSQIETYLACPYRYKLHHVLKIPTAGKGNMSFGTTIHGTLQRFYEQVKVMNSVHQDSLFNTAPISATRSEKVRIPSLDELLVMYEEAWIPDWYRDKKERETFYEKGKQFLRLFYSANEGRWNVPLLLESSFTIMVGPYKLRGRIDRVDLQEDGTLEIVDYKTGNAKEKLVGDDKHQLLIYQIAATALPAYRHYGKVGKLTFYYVKDGIKTSFLGTDSELEALQEKLLTTIEDIHRGEFKATPSPYICGTCDYREICEYRQL